MSPPKRHRHGYESLEPLLIFEVDKDGAFSILYPTNCQSLCRCRLVPDRTTAQQAISTAHASPFSVRPKRHLFYATQAPSLLRLLHIEEAFPRKTVYHLD